MSLEELKQLIYPGREIEVYYLDGSFSCIRVVTRTTEKSVFHVQKGRTQEFRDSWNTVLSGFNKLNWELRD